MTSSRGLTDTIVQAGKPYAPFPTKTDFKWAQVTTEIGLGKRKHLELTQTVRSEGFDPEEMRVTSEGKRQKLMHKLPSVVDTC